MDCIYVFDLSAMESLNAAVSQDDNLIDKLNILTEEELLLFCDQVRDECKLLLKGQPITRWAIPTFRGFKKLAQVTFEDCQKALAAVPDILDEMEEGESQALKTIALAYHLDRAGVDVVVVSDEDITLEARCTVGEACAQMQIRALNVPSFLREVGALLSAA